MDTGVDALDKMTTAVGQLKWVTAEMAAEMLTASTALAKASSGAHKASDALDSSKQGLEHKHCGSLHASDAAHALEAARDVYTRRQEGVSIWVVESKKITASNPDDKGELFDPAADKIYRHPTFYEIPEEVGHM